MLAVPPQPCDEELLAKVATSKPMPIRKGRGVTAHASPFVPGASSSACTPGVEVPPSQSVVFEPVLKSGSGVHVFVIQVLSVSLPVIGLVSSKFKVSDDLITGARAGVSLGTDHLWSHSWSAGKINLDQPSFRQASAGDRRRPPTPRKPPGRTGGGAESSDMQDPVWLAYCWDGDIICQGEEMKIRSGGGSSGVSGGELGDHYLRSMLKKHDFVTVRVDSDEHTCQVMRNDTLVGSYSGVPDSLYLAVSDRRSKEVAVSKPFRPGSAGSPQLSEKGTARAPGQSHSSGKGTAGGSAFRVHSCTHYAHPVHACRRGDVALLKKLLLLPRYSFAAKGPDDSYQGATALYEAVRCGSRQCFDCLLEAGADLHNVSLDCRGLAHAAAEANRADFIDALHGKQCPMTVADKNGVTPLIVAICMNHIAAVVALMKCGAVLTSFDGDGCDPSRYTQDSDTLAVCRFAAQGRWNAVDDVLEKKEQCGLIEVRASNENTRQSGGWRTLAALKASSCIGGSDVTLAHVIEAKGKPARSHHWTVAAVRTHTQAVEKVAKRGSTSTMSSAQKKFGIVGSATVHKANTAAMKASNAMQRNAMQQAKKAKELTPRSKRGGDVGAGGDQKLNKMNRKVHHAVGIFTLVSQSRADVEDMREKDIDSNPSDSIDAFAEELDEAVCKKKAASWKERNSLHQKELEEAKETCRGAAISLSKCGNYFVMSKPHRTGKYPAVASDLFEDQVDAQETLLRTIDALATEVTALCDTALTNRAGGHTLHGSATT